MADSNVKQVTASVQSPPPDGLDAMRKDVAASDLCIEITPRMYTRYYGTAAQLIAEGLIPKGAKWPPRNHPGSFTTGKFHHSVARCRPPGHKGPMSTWIEGDYWRLQRSLNGSRGGCYEADIYEKTKELSDVIKRGTREWSITCNRAWEAEKDDKYMAHMRKILGEPKSGRGRPSKSDT